MRAARFCLPILFLLLVGLFCLGESRPVLAQSTESQDQAALEAQPFSIKVANWTDRLNQIEAYLSGGATDKGRSKQALSGLEEIRTGADGIKAEAQSSLSEAESRLETLGAKPEEGEPEEPADIRRKREQIQSEINFYKSRLTLADLALTRVDALEQELSRSARTRLVERMTTSGPLPYDPTTVVQAVADFGAVLRGVAAIADRWWANLPDEKRAVDRMLISILGFIVGAILIAWLARRLLLRRFGAHPTEEPPAYSQRLIAAVAEGLSKGLIPAAILGIIVARTQTESAITYGDLGNLIGLAGVMLIIYIVAVTLPQSVLSPEYPEWRLTRLTSENARRVLFLIRLIALLFCVDEFLIEATDRIEGLRGLRTPALYAVWTLFFNTAQGLLVFALLRPSLWTFTSSPDEASPEETTGTRSTSATSNPTTQGDTKTGTVSPHDAALEEDADEDDPPIEQAAGLDGAAAAARAGAGAGFWKLLRLVLATLSIVGMIAPFAGYSALGNYLLNNLLGTGLVVGGLYILRGLFRELIGLASSSRLLRDQMNLEYKTRTRIKFWSRALMDLLVIVIGVLLVAPTWGVSQLEILRWLRDAFDGFTIGSVRISVAEIVFGVITFFVILALTGTTKRTLSERVLPQTQIDEGVQHSITAGIGYAGFVIAAALAIAVMGVDLSNIAIIAGALSVGIGFGLQNIVNNFVSGLILLIERPIKAGDWVVVGDKEGFVKQVSMRATEIETWHRASVIIPNSDLLSSALQNWTLRDKYGRVDMDIGVSLDSDPKVIEKVLLQVARRHPRVVRWPQPAVLLMAVGESRLQFQLRVYSDDIVWQWFIASDLRVEAVRRFKDEGIVIPFDQQVVHLERGDPRAPRDSDGNLIPPPLPKKPRRSAGSDSEAAPANSGTDKASNPKGGPEDGSQDGPPDGPPDGEASSR